LFVVIAAIFIMFLSSLIVFLQYQNFDTFCLNNEHHRNEIATKPGVVYPDSVIMLGRHNDLMDRIN